MKIGNLEVYGIIYKIINKINSKVYIGQTTKNKGFNERYYYKGEGIERVYNCHKYGEKHNRSYNAYLLHSIEKYGFEAFEVIKIFDIAFSKEELDIKEDFWINYYDCINNGYNWKEGGSNGKLSEETKKKLSVIKKGMYVGEKNPMYGRCGKLSPMYGTKRPKEKAGMFGKHHKKETRMKMSIVQKGKIFSEETKQKMRKNHADFNGENHPMFGKHLSDETKKKLSISLKGLNKGKDSPHAVQVYIYDLNKNLLHKSDTVIEASEWMVKNKYINTINTGRSAINKYGKDKPYRGLYFKKLA